MPFFTAALCAHIISATIPKWIRLLVHLQKCRLRKSKNLRAKHVINRCPRLTGKVTKCSIWLMKDEALVVIYAIRFTQPRLPSRGTKTLITAKDPRKPSALTALSHLFIKTTSFRIIDSVSLKLPRMVVVGVALPKVGRLRRRKKVHLSRVRQKLILRQPHPKISK